MGEAMKRVKIRYYVATSIALLLMAIVMGLAPPRVAAMQPLPLTSTSLALNPDDPAQQTVGRLRFMGGLVLKSTNRDFGGLSGLRAGADGHMLAITDTGFWVAFNTIERGGRLVRAARTAPGYRLYALPGTTPPKPGMVRAPEAAGPGIALEIWELGFAEFGTFVAGIPAPLSVGTIALDDGSTVQGFLCEAAGLDGALDITHFGGWRDYLAHRAAAPS